MNYLKTLTLSALTLGISTAYAAELVKLNRVSQLPLDVQGFNQSTDLGVVKKYNGHTRYEQKINGIPVYGHQLIKHQINDKVSYTGNFVKTSQKELGLLAATPKVTQSDALHIAKNEFLKGRRSFAGHSFQNEQSKLYYVLDGKDQLRLSYVVSFFSDTTPAGHPSRPFYIIDANSKEIVRQWEGLTTDKIGAGPGGNEKIGRYEYGTDYPNLDVKVEGDGETCSMVTENVKTVNLEQEYGGSKTFEYKCPYHTDDDKINGGYSAVNDAHFFGGVIFSMYKDWYDIAPLTFRLMLRVHYGDHFENAFWNGSSMTFGDGHYYFYPLVALDVVAHEVSHGVTEQNSDLEYWGQSGGINEAFSDMAGKLAEFYMRGKNTWGIGEDIIKSDEPLRYMDTPDKDGRSISDARDYKYGIDVHYSSGVYNKFFFTLATKEGWTTRKAFDVMLGANQHYWDRETDYISGAEGILNATKDLGYNEKDVVDAAFAVGIECDHDGSDDPWFCKLRDYDKDHPKPDDDDLKRA